jgi:hypothetical protein
VNYGSIYEHSILKPLRLTDPGRKPGENELIRENPEIPISTLRF